MFQYKIFGKDKPPVFEILPQITTFFNAFTAPDTTHYMLQGRKEELKTFIRIEAARMVGDCRALPPADSERSRPGPGWPPPARYRACIPGATQS